RVTAHNAGGESSATSAATGTVTTLNPANTALPEIEGSAVKDQTLTVKDGSWDNSPTTFSRHWLRCDSAGANCAAISGATGGAYVLTVEDVGHELRVEVSAENAHGQASATSAPTALVVYPVPVNNSPPTITGSAVEGQTLTATEGAWANGTTSI